MLILPPHVYQTMFGVFNWLLRGRMPALLAVCALIERDERVLLLDRVDGLGFCLPGGIVRWGESCHEALCREVWEETGLLVAPRAIVNVNSKPGRDPRFSCVQIVFTVEIRGGATRGSAEGVPLWFDREHLPVQLGFDHSMILQDYLKAREWEVKC